MSTTLHIKLMDGKEAPQIDCFSANIDQIQDVLAAVDGYSLVVIDTPPAVEFFPEQIKALILRSDFILVPTGTTRDDTDSTIEFMEVVQGLAKPAAYVLCKVNRRARSLLEGVELEAVRNSLKSPKATV